MTLAFTAPALAAGIVPDGATKTTLQTNGATTTVSTATVAGANAFNSFSQFNVTTGQTVNLMLPTGTSNLINLVRGQTVNINGIVNSYKNNEIGGNVYFAASSGIVIGQNGVLNVGTLHLSTPTNSFLSSFFSADGTPSSAATAAVLSNTMPIDPNGFVSVQGKINTNGAVDIDSGRVRVGGAIVSSAAAAASNQIDISDVVNTDGLQTGVALTAFNGKISIVAAKDVSVTGTIASEGSDNVAGGMVAI